MKSIKFINTFCCTNGTYSLEVTVSYPYKDMKWRYIEYKRLSPGFESMLIDEEELTKKINDYLCNHEAELLAT